LNPNQGEIWHGRVYSAWVQSATPNLAVIGEG